MSNLNFLVDENNAFIQTVDNVALNDNENNMRWVYVDKGILIAMGQLSGYTINEMLLPADLRNDSVVLADVLDDTDEMCQKSKWLHGNILALLAAFKKFYQSPGLRKPQIYNLISKEICTTDFNRTAKQCQFKFAALKKMYVKYKDAQKSGNSGGTPINFTYSEEMDDIFGSSHIHGLPRPVASSTLADTSSSSSTSSFTSSSLLLETPTFTSATSHTSNHIFSDDEETINSPKRRRMTVSETIHVTMAKMSEENAKRQNQRLEVAEKLMEFQERSLKKHEELMLKLIEKL